MFKGNHSDPSIELINNLSSKDHLNSIVPLHSFLDATVIYYQVLPYLFSYLSFLDEVPLIGLIYMFSFPLYYIISEFFFQKTIGKFFTNSVVINEYGEKPDLKTIVVRTVVRCIPVDPFTYFASNRGWHDRWSNTYVVKKSEVTELGQLLANPANLEE